MPSDTRESLAAPVIEGPLGAFRSALAATLEEVRGMLAVHRAVTTEDREEDAAELGAFAAGRIDFDRFAALLTRTDTVDAAAADVVEAAERVLTDLAQRPEESIRIDVEEGASLRDAIARALAEVGRAFGASRVVGLARSGGYQEAEHADWLDSFPPTSWNPAERALAPALLVRVAGRDLRAEGLVEFLDGDQKLVLLVRGESSPAPLSRLVTPGVCVVQTHDDTGLDRLAEWSGPGVAALLPESAACFVHDPAAGMRIGERLEITNLPDEESIRTLGGQSVWQQREQLRHLVALASESTGGEAPPEVVAGEEPAGSVDRLAAFLLDRVDLREPGH